MFGKEKKPEEKKPERFQVMETHTIIGVCKLVVICDQSTGVHYLATGGDSFTFSSITPLLDENGNVVIDRNRSQY